MGEDGTGGGLSTRCVHAGDARDAEGALHAPLYTHTTFGFDSTADLLDVLEGRRVGNIYTRYGFNPTIRAVEAKLADLEGAEAALAFASGMAAESAAILGHVRAGDHVVCVGDVYGGTQELIGWNLPRLGVDSTFLMADEADGLAEALRENTRLVFFETPTNPGLAVIDIAAAAAASHAAGALVIVDNTFASPVNQTPLEHGADLVVHSATKYLGGHSDLTAGAVMGSAELLKPIWNWRKSLGQTIGPEVAFLLSRSLRTLAVRVRAQNAGAEAVARFLAGHPRVVEARHPALLEGRAAEIAARQMRGFGGMVTFTVDGGGAAATAVVDGLRLIANAVSLGSVESLATQPIASTHHDLTPEERARRGIADGMVRLSIGLEDPEDLIADLEQALGG